MFERREQREEKEQGTYYVGLPGQFDDEEATYEEDISTDSKEQGTDQYDRQDSLNVFVGPAAEDDFVRLQRDFYEKYGEHKELSQCVWKAMHSTFPIASTSAIVSNVV